MGALGRTNTSKTRGSSVEGGVPFPVRRISVPTTSTNICSISPLSAAVSQTSVVALPLSAIAHARSAARLAAKRAAAGAGGGPAVPLSSRSSLIAEDRSSFPPAAWTSNDSGIPPGVLPPSPSSPGSAKKERRRMRLPTRKKTSKKNQKNKTLLFRNGATNGRHSNVIMEHDALSSRADAAHLEEDGGEGGVTLHTAAASSFSSHGVTEGTCATVAQRRRQQRFRLLLRRLPAGESRTASPPASDPFAVAWDSSTATEPRRSAELRARLLANGGAWTCGICGAAFPSFSRANVHEAECIVVAFCWEESVAMKVRRRMLLVNDTGADTRGSGGLWKSAPGVERPGNAGTGISMMAPPEIPRITAARKGTGTRVFATTAGGCFRRGPVASTLCSQLLPVQYASETSPPSPMSVDSVLKKTTVLHFRPPISPDMISLSEEVKRCILFTDEATVKVVRRTRAMALTLEERRAQRELALLSRDRRHYALLRGRAALRAANARGQQRTGGSKERNRMARKARAVRSRFKHAYELVKEGPSANGDGVDRYDEKNLGQGTHDATRARGISGVGNAGHEEELSHDGDTLYVNVVVKNSVQVVNNELQRLARGWWEESINAKDVDNTDTSKRERGGREEGGVLDFQFEWIRTLTQKKVIQLAGLALASDFTPKKVAVQLSNDLFRLMGPQLELRGVTIQTDIEYRVGPYFVLAVNIIKIDWILLMEHTSKMLKYQKRKWAKDQKIRKRLAVDAGSENGVINDEERSKKKHGFKARLKAFRQVFPTRNEGVVHILAMINELHFIIAVPLLHIFYRLFFKYAINKFILTAVTDDIFRYVEKKGMEMQLEIKNAKTQSSFMLAALREMREDSKRRKKKGCDEDDDSKPILGPLLGPAVKEDQAGVKPPPNFDTVDNLEFVGLEVDLPVGFLRLRWAFLNVKSKFLIRAFFEDVMNYDQIVFGKWSVNEDDIGAPKVLDGVDESDFVGATLEYVYLMPKSAFVKANMCDAKFEITHYDRYCFVIKEKTLTPEVPYGNSFVAWTQYTISDTGKGTCRMVCSVEAEFPNGPPMVARQIKSGMRSGTAEKFVQLGETICRYADAFP